MTNPYFDINLPNNNKIWSYDLWNAEQTDALALMRPQDLYKIVPFAFNTYQANEGFAAQLKDFIKKCLKDKRTHKYFAVRCRYNDTPQNTTNRNNIIHALLSTPATILYPGDIELVKEIITCAVEAGVHPLEKSINWKLSPVGMFMETNNLRKKYGEGTVCLEELDFLQFLINFHPQSLVDFSEENKCALSALSPNYLERDVGMLARYHLVIKNLPIEAIDTNIQWFERAYKSSGQEFAQLLGPALEELKIRREKIIICENLNNLNTSNKATSLDTKIEGKVRQHKI